MTFVSSRYEVSGNIADMSVSDGLKDALVKCGFIDRQQILSYTTGELASILEIDQYVAKLNSRSSQAVVISSNLFFIKTTRYLTGYNYIILKN